jgi:two-component system alkaline phosphatase synthesis response regulator PhoP
MSRRILVVDDEPEFSELLQFRLRSRRYDVISAATGTEALERVREDKPDVILMDLMLPDLDGLTLCEILQRQESTRNTPIIMISAVSSEITRCSARIAGAITFLGKPLDFEHLIKHLERLLPPECESEPAAQRET